MHGLETINRLNMEAQEQWRKKDACTENQKMQACDEKSFLIFSLKQALGFSKSNRDVAVLLGIALRLVEKKKV